MKADQKQSEYLGVSKTLQHQPGKNSSHLWHCFLSHCYWLWTLKRKNICDDLITNIFIFSKNAPKCHRFKPLSLKTLEIVLHESFIHQNVTFNDIRNPKKSHLTNYKLPHPQKQIQRGGRQAGDSKKQKPIFEGAEL